MTKILKVDELLKEAFLKNELNDDYRMYFVSYENTFWDTFEGTASDVTDADFVRLAEEEGQVYTLSGFQEAFNAEDAPLGSNNAVRILPKEIYLKLQ